MRRLVTLVVLLPAVFARPLLGSALGQLLLPKTQRNLRPEFHWSSLMPKPHLKLRNSPPDVVSVAESDSAVIECEAGGNPPPTVYWLKNGRKIDQGNADSPVEESAMMGFGLTRSRLFIDCASAEYDEAQYTCVAENPYHRVSKSTKLKVDGAYRSAACLVKKSFTSPGSPARITMWTHTRMELVGSTVRLFCRATGAPRPNVVWFGPDDNELRSGDKYRILENGDLEIRNIAWNDMGGYTCSAENTHGEDRTSTFLYPTVPDKV